MALGELVGEAFIRITADTTPMRRAVKRAAKQAGQDYTSEFGKEVEASADAKLRRARQRLAEALVDPEGFDSLRKQFSSVEEAADNFRGQLAELNKQGDLNKREMKSLVAQINKWEKATLAVEEAARKEVAAQARVNAMMDESKTRYAEAERLRKAEAQSLEDMLVAQRRLAVEKTQIMDAELRAHEKRIKEDISLDMDAAASRRKVLEGELDAVERVERETSRITEKVRKDWERLHEVESKAVTKMVEDQEKAFRSYERNIKVTKTREELEKTNPAILRLAKSMGKFDDAIARSGDRVGKMFGKGARNNFFNLFGRVVEGVATGPLRLFTKGIASITETVGEMVGAFGKVRLDGGGIFSALTASGGVLASSLGSVLPALAAFAAAITALTFILPAAVSGLFLLAGAATAIAGAITLGLVGALLTVSPLLLAFGGVIGGVILLVTQFKEESSEVREILGKMTDKLKAFVKSLDLTTASKGLVDSVSRILRLDGINRFIQGALDGIDQFVRSFVVTLTGPEVDKALRSFGGRLPELLGTLGSALGNLTSGLIVFFEELAPYTQRMLDAFDLLTERFFVWINSAEGKTSLREFMDKAYEAADKLVGIAGNLFEILGKVFGIAQDEAGGSFLDYLDRITSKFNAFLDSPEGKEAVKNFFTDVKQTMIDVKDLFVELADRLGELDTEQAREDFDTFLETLHNLAEGFRIVTENFDDFRTTITLLTTPFLGLIDIARRVYDELFGHSWIVDIVEGFEEWMPRIPKAIVDALVGIYEKMTDPFRRAAARLVEIVTGLPGKVSEFVSQMPGKVTTGLTGLTTAFSEPFNRARTIVGERLSAVREKVTTGVQGIPGRVTLALTTLASKFDAPFRSAFNTVSGWVTNIRNLIDGLLSKAREISTAVGNAVSTGTSRLPKFAAGTIVNGPTKALIGEAGREAVVPLDRPLSMIDKSVRGLAAVAQGKAMAAGGVAGGRSITVMPGAIVVQVPTANPEQAAAAVLDRFVSEYR